MSDRTTPSQNLGGIPLGTPTQIGENEDEEVKRSLERENKSAITLAKAGYNIEQNPDIPGRKRPDYKIEGKIFDCYSPTTRKARNLVNRVAKKINELQTERIVLNLDDSTVSLKSLRQQLVNNPIPDLKEILLIKNEKIIHFYPFN